jgi:hypothetical protein
VLCHPLPSASDDITLGGFSCHRRENILVYRPLCIMCQLVVPSSENVLKISLTSLVVCIILHFVQAYLYRSAEDAYSCMTLGPIFGMTRCPYKIGFYSRLFRWPDLDTLTLTVDCSVDMTWTHWFCLWVPLLPDLHTITLTVVCSVTWSWHTNFDCGLFRYLILTH